MRGRTTARPVAGSGLGVLRSDADTTPEATPGTTLVAVTKADARSTVHRRTWLDQVTVTLPGTDGGGTGGSARQHRLVGLFPSAAAAHTVREVPLDRKSTRLNSSHANISYAVFCLKQK